VTRLKSCDSVETRALDQAGHRPGLKTMLFELNPNQINIKYILEFGN